MGNIIGVNAHRVRLDSLKRRLREGGYQLHATPHFLVCHQPGPPAVLAASSAPTLLIHWFSPDAIDSNLGHYLMEELKPLGMLANPRQYGEIIGAVVNSVSPRDPEQAWRLFATNTLQQLRDLLMCRDWPCACPGGGAKWNYRVESPGQAQGQSLHISNQPATDCAYPISVFAALYQRVYDLCLGESLLDAGCSSGFLPLTIAELLPSLTNVVGLDINADPFAVARIIAYEQRLANVQFIQADLLSDELTSFPSFDTVTALHVLEHFSEPAMYRVLANLLKLTTHRLILAVPFEQGEPEPAYGQKQLFTREKLEAVGHWCVERWGDGRVRYEHCAGGLLWVDRLSQVTL
jgi:SAM-dependent methyltransferase